MAVTGIDPENIMNKRRVFLLLALVLCTIIAGPPASRAQDAGGPAFEFAYTDRSGLIGVSYAGPCEVRPTLLLSTARQSELERTSSTPPDLRRYAEVARAASPDYAKHCPGVTRILYAIDRLPEPWICAQGAECFIEAEFDGDWSAYATQFKRKELGEPLLDLAEMADVLAAGRFDVIAVNDWFFSRFAISFFGSYSDYCREYIRHPVERGFQMVERTKMGPQVIDERPLVSVSIKVERGYLDVYDAHYGRATQWMLNRMWTKIAASGESQENPFAALGAVASIADKELEYAGVMRGLLEGRCTADKTTTILRNILNYSRSLPPVAGRYSIARPLVPQYAPNGSSAPQFAASYAQRITQARRTLREQKEHDLAEQYDAKMHSPSNAPTRSAGTSPRAPGSAEEVSNALAGMEEIARLHAAAANRARAEYETKLKNARTPEERSALSRAYQQQQREMQEDLKNELRKQSGR